MFIERLLNQGTSPLLEQMVRFTELRHRLLMEDVANVSTPGFRQKDLSKQKFQSALRDRIEQRDSAPPGSVGFEDVSAENEDLNHQILFHDGNNRSMEQLMSDSAKNALLHNMTIELLRKQFNQLDMALKERVT
jgi:flagellar basal-body rod protein FlgB